MPINIVKPIIEKLKKDGNFTEGSIGIYAYDKEVVRYLDENIEIDTGIYVVSIKKDGAAFGKGLLVGDIITKIDDIELNKMSDLRKAIYGKAPGDKVMLMVKRKGKNFGIEIELGKK